MTTSAACPPETTLPVQPLLTRPLLLRFVSMIGASVSFFLLLSVVPAYAAEAGGGGAAGLATGSLMLSTVLGELITPRLVARHGYRATLMAGLFLLGAPAMVLTVSGSMAWIVAVCLVRGLGFALTIVAGGALTASLIPAERRGEGLAVVGVVSGVPSLIALPLGLWLVGQVGYGPVAVAAGVAALAAIVSVLGLPDRQARPSEESVGVIRGLCTGALLRPVVVFAATATAAGILVTFLPLAVPSASAGVVTVALFAQTAAATVSRWVAGRYGDRHGSARLVLPALLLSAAGVPVTAATGSALTVVAGTALFGAGFGIAQNATLTLMYARVSASSYGTVSALWNLAYDGGMGVGAAGFGVLAGLTGYPWAFAVTAVLMLGALAPALRDLRHPGH
ncbi:MULTISPECIES: MFS transporter [unclassified Streptomyces]|uniref:MFS transporter n=1 Tax=unclassified Streptomyces TaxID=2593676 RepID=UPI002255AB2C|nr:MULTISPECIES: MFS transporter [unclassified Streptomyces]MCX5051248.1 MFS transporter [Streptomyces sp. NBC_00474]MCX5249133.1 MFS transporter [Streptomyces sp. NBC_00201]